MRVENICLFILRVCIVITWSFLLGSASCCSSCTSTTTGIGKNPLSGSRISLSSNKVIWRRELLFWICFRSILLGEVDCSCTVKCLSKSKFHVNSKKRTIIIELEHKCLLYATKEFKGIWHCCFVLGVSDLA